MVKKSFVLYTDKYEAIRFLTQEQKGDLLDAIYRHEIGEELPQMDAFTSAMFTLIRQTLEENAQKYAETVEKRREAGKKGGLASGLSRKANEANALNAEANEANASRNEANEADNDNDNVNDNDNDIKEIVAQDAPTPRKRKEKVQRHKYGEYENVLLSDEEYQKVIAEYPADYQVRIDRLSEYMKSTGKSYKDHLATIRAWARKDKDKPQAPVRTSYGNSFHNFKERQYDYDDLMERIRAKNAL